MKLHLHIWRQENEKSKGGVFDYTLDGISDKASFLEMLDILNEKLIEENKEPIAFDHDCREGICGTCSLMINGIAHGPDKAATTCQLHMRKFKDGDHIYIEPWRAKSFKVLKDLIVDRSSFENIMQSGGYVSVNTGGVPDANSIPINKQDVELSMDGASCIGCGACVAACKNASAMLFISAKISHLNLLPQGQIEKYERVKNMIDQAEKEGFGACSNTYECEAVCPKEISISNIARMNREYFISKIIKD